MDLGYKLLILLLFIILIGLIIGAVIAELYTRADVQVNYNVPMSVLDSSTNNNGSPGADCDIASIENDNLVVLCRNVGSTGSPSYSSFPIEQCGTTPVWNWDSNTNQMSCVPSTTSTYITTATNITFNPPNAATDGAQCITYPYLDPILRFVSQPALAANCDSLAINNGVLTAKCTGLSDIAAGASPLGMNTTVTLGLANCAVGPITFIPAIAPTPTTAGTQPRFICTPGNGFS